MSDTPVNTEKPSEDEIPKKRDTTFSGEVSMGKAISIFPSKPLPKYDRGPVKAFAATVETDSASAHYALVCQNDLMPRLMASRKYASIESQHLIRLVASNVVYWPPAREERFVYIYEDIQAVSLASVIERKGFLGWKYEEVLHYFIEPFSDLMFSCRDKGMFHGHMSLDNIFVSDPDGAPSKLMLGECLSTPPSYLTPAYYLPVERAVTDPIGRGIGRAEDDLYSIGVCIAMLMRHKMPSVQESAREIARKKIDIGSYGFNSSGERFSGPAMELLRGLLFDTASQRWTIDELGSWLDGQRHNVRQIVRSKKASRPIEIAGKSYLNPRYIAEALYYDPEEAARIISDGEIKQWITRSLEDRKMSDRLDKLLGLPGVMSAKKHTEDRMIAMTSMALSPEAPIRFQGHNWRPEGISYALANIMAHGEDYTPFIEIVNNNIVSIWVEEQPSVVGIDVSKIIGQFSEVKKFLRQTGIGYGIERCLYYLCPGAPCMSPFLRGYYTISPEAVILTLEKLAIANADQLQLPIDRHIAAFISLKHPVAINGSLNDLGAKDPSRRLLGALKTFSIIQKKTKLPALPGLSKWFVDQIGVVLRRYHDRTKREDMLKKCQAAIAQGNLDAIRTIVDTPTGWQNDYDGYENAKREYQLVLQEEAKLQKALQNTRKFSTGVGQEVSAIVAGVISGLIIISFAFFQFLNNATLW